MEPIGRTEKAIGCGAVTGLFLAFFLGVGLWADLTPLGVAMLVGEVALACGAAVRHFGDEFWHILASWLWWW